MRDLNEELKEDIREALYKHGKLAILFYDIDGDKIIHKWGEFDRLSKIHQERFDKFMKIGFEEEANSLILLELPEDENEIFKILSGNLKGFLKEHNLTF